MFLETWTLVSVSTRFLETGPNYTKYGNPLLVPLLTRDMQDTLENILILSFVYFCGFKLKRILLIFFKLLRFHKQNVRVCSKNAATTDFEWSFDLFYHITYHILVKSKTSFEFSKKVEEDLQSAKIYITTCCITRTR